MSFKVMGKGLAYNLFDSTYNVFGGIIHELLIKK